MADQGGNTSLKALFQGMSDAGIAVLQGTVKSADPLKIQIANDEKLTIGPNITYLPRHLTDYTIEAAADWGNGDDDGGGAPVRKRITVHSSLKAGESVHILSFNHGKQYFVLDRVG